MPTLEAFTAQVPLPVATTVYTQQLSTDPGIRVTGSLLGMAHKHHRHHRCFQNNTYYSTNSGLEKRLMLLDLNTLTTVLCHKLICTHFKKKQYRQIINIGQIQQVFFLSFVPPKRVIKYSSSVYWGKVTFHLDCTTPPDFSDSSLTAHHHVS